MVILTLYEIIFITTYGFYNRFRSDDHSYHYSCRMKIFFFNNPFSSKFRNNYRSKKEKKMRKMAEEKDVTK